MIPLQHSRKVEWTHHAHDKMRYYKLSESRVRRILHSPKRIEEGIAPDTIAMMQPAGNEKNPYELWVMIQDKKDARLVISAWRYPGVTKVGEPLPPEILRELRNFL